MPPTRAKKKTQERNNGQMATYVRTTERKERVGKIKGADVTDGKSYTARSKRGRKT